MSVQRITTRPLCVSAGQLSAQETGVSASQPGRGPRFIPRTGRLKNATGHYIPRRVFQVTELGPRGCHSMPWSPGHSFLTVRAPPLLGELEWIVCGRAHGAHRGRSVPPLVKPVK